jgi:hypothetical protein
MLASKYHEGRMPTHGYEATREAALQALTKSWQMRKGAGDIPEPEASRAPLPTEEVDTLRAERHRIMALKGGGSVRFR